VVYLLHRSVRITPQTRRGQGAVFPNTTHELTSVDLENS
jgi:hypothetical protein